MMNIRILFLSANVSRSESHNRDASAENSTAAPGLGWLDIDREYNEIQRALAFPGLRGFPVIEMIPAIQWVQLGTILQEATSPMVLHFSGHGDASGALYMLSERGTPIAVPVGSLVSQLRQHRRRLSLVVLNACYTDDLAQRLIDDVDVVIGMEHRVTDDAAILFSTTFYYSLVVCGDPIAAAFEKACITVGGRYPDQQVHARMRQQSGVDPGAIWLFQIPLREVPTEREFEAYIDAELRDLVAASQPGDLSAKQREEVIARLSAIEKTLGAAIGALRAVERYSIGGSSALALLARKLADLKNRVFAIAMVLQTATKRRSARRDAVTTARAGSTPM